MRSIEAIRYAGATASVGQAVVKIQPAQEGFEIIFADGHAVQVFNPEWIRWSAPFEICAECGKKIAGKEIHRSTCRVPGPLCFECYHKAEAFEAERRQLAHMAKRYEEA